MTTPSEALAELKKGYIIQVGLGFHQANSAGNPITINAEANLVSATDTPKSCYTVFLVIIY
jgi:hypothetical protein